MRKWLGLAIVSGIGWLLLSCSVSQQLTSITIQPQSQSFGGSDVPLKEDAGASVQLRALGSYIHPPATKDITDQVTWAANTTGIATVNSTGVLTATGEACGNDLVSATIQTNMGGSVSSSGAIVTGYMTATVICFTSGGPTITADFTGAGTGTITSSPIGLGCAATCTASFPVGASVTITASPTGASTFGGWAGCDSVSGTTCLIQNLTTDITVTVTFN